MTQRERKERFEKYFKELDKNDSNQLSYDEFKEFLNNYNEGKLDNKLYEFFFNGADIDNGGSIDKEELWELSEALYNNDDLYKNKLFFRAIDKNKSGEIDAEEFLKIAELNNSTMTLEDAEAQIKRITNGSNVMNFAQMHKVLTGEDIPIDTDPYDGKLKSGKRTRALTSNNDGGLTEGDKNKIRELFAKYDKSGNGKLEFDEFLGFMKEALNVTNPSPSFLKQMRFIYDGMDIDGSHNLDQSEIIECFDKIKAKDFKYQTKMIFRGADRNHNKKVTIDELKLAVENLGDKSFNQESFDAQCKQEFGSKKKELEYWEFYKIISGETIEKSSPDYDPYDGKITEKSKCCLLI